VPALALGAALLYWVAPAKLQRMGTAAFKSQAQLLREIPAQGESVTYFGNNYWSMANPLQYYGEKSLDPSTASLEEAVAKARGSQSGLLLLDRSHWNEADPALATARMLAQGGNWVLLTVQQP
jgi:hypothetical protein